MQKMSQLDAELYQRIDEVLHYIWDPIRVSGLPNARDEYTTYTDQTFSLIKKSATVDDIAKYLFSVTTERMGMQGNLKHAAEVANILVDWHESLQNKHSQ